MPYAVAAAAVTAGAGMYESGQATKNQKNAIAPTQQAQNALYAGAESIASTPYTAYTGQEAAPLSANQQYAAQKAASDPTQDGSAADFAKAGGQADFIAGNQWNSATASKYMNPYTQAVTDKALGVEQRNYQTAVNAQGTANATQGAFGGDRAALGQTALAGENQLNQGTTEAQGQASAYDNAGKMWQADNQRAAGAASAYDASGNAIVGASNSEIANLNSTGTAQQMTQQAQDSAKYNDYLDARSWQANQLAPLEAAVGKNVYANPQNTNAATAALGAGAAAMGAYGKSQSGNSTPNTSPDGGNPDNLGGSTPTAPDGSSLTYDGSGNITGSTPNSIDGSNGYFSVGQQNAMTAPDMSGSDGP
jgi:hypothetical protein